MAFLSMFCIGSLGKVVDVDVTWDHQSKGRAEVCEFPSLAKYWSRQPFLTQPQDVLLRCNLQLVLYMRQLISPSV